MPPIATSDTIREKDIDHVLAEVLCEPSFTRWFVDRVLGEPFKDFLGEPIVETQKSYTNGSSKCIVDVQVCLTYRQPVLEAASATPQTEKVYLLIENKLDAHLSDEQVDKYQATKAKLSQNSTCEALTILIAPDAYLERNAQKASEFDHKIAYEEIILSTHGQYPQLTEALNKAELRLSGIADQLNIVNRLTQLITTKLDESHHKINNSVDQIKRPLSLVNNYSLQLQELEIKLNRLQRNLVTGFFLTGGALVVVAVLVLFR